MTDRLAPESRHKYFHQGRQVYEWEQTLDEVNIFVPVPPDTRAADLTVTILPHWLTFGMVGCPPYLDRELAGRVRRKECVWTLEDGELHIQMAKMVEGEPWPSALKGHEASPEAAGEDKKRLMLERFQQENPGMDFSNAQFNGDVPNPATFMGGIKKA